MNAKQKNTALALLFLMLSVAIFGATLNFIPRGVGMVFAMIPAIPTLLIARHFVRKAKADPGPPFS